MRGPSTKAFKQGFLRNLLRGLNSCRRNGACDMSLQDRKRAVRSSADAAMATAHAGGPRWPRALLLALTPSSSSSSPPPGKTGRKKMARRLCGKRRSSTCSSSISCCEIARRLVRKRTKVLRRMVPGGELLADGASLLREAMDYVVHLRAQVAVLRRVSEAMHAQGSKLHAGMDAWPGKQMHSNSYRVPEPFAGQVDRAEEDGSVVFQDGSRVKADVIMHCTGYNYSFPFLGEDSTISVDDNRVGPLYKHVLPPQLAPRLSFIGLPHKVAPFPLFELQSNWVAGVLSGRIELPSEEEMTRDVTEFYSELSARGWPRRYTHSMLSHEFEYEDWLAVQCRRERVTEWRKELFAAALGMGMNTFGRMGSYRDEWDAGDGGGKLDQLLAQANREFAQYSSPATPPP